MKAKPTIERLREVISYNQETGELTWLKNTSVRNVIGCCAGHFHKTQKYLVVGIDGCTLKGHQVAWALMTGSWPVTTVDHRDRNRGNNKWSNLRVASKFEQSLNQSIRKNNKSGARGVFNLRRGRLSFMAQIRFKGRMKYLGVYGSFEEAKEVRDLWESMLFGEFSTT